jgi:hypothetical protein
VAKVIAPDPDKVASGEPQEVAGFGVFPRRLADDDRTEAEWEELIEQHNLPLRIVDSRSNKVPTVEEKAQIAQQPPPVAESEAPPISDADAADQPAEGEEEES